MSMYYNWSSKKMWMDCIPQLKFATMINGFTEINLTKLDVLSAFDEVKIGVQYTIHGQPVNGMPASLKSYSDVVVKYETLPGWKVIFQTARNLLTCLKMQKYVLRCEELLGVPIRWIEKGRLDRLIVSKILVIHCVEAKTVHAVF